MHQQYVSVLLFASAGLASSALEVRQTCQQGYSLCSPDGATTATTPQIGSADFANLFQDIVLSSLPSSSSSKRALSPRGGSASLCCTASLACLTMHSLSIPFCYDKFTTNYFLPDDSYGTVVGGAYTSKSGDHANLETGNYTMANGQTGNIYSANSAEIPNTATLPLPSQYTATGVGSAIPASALGGVTVTLTTTMPGSTISPTTLSPSTISETVSLETLAAPTTVTTSISNSQVVSVKSGSQTTSTTIPASTIPASTVSGTTMSGSVATITTVEPTGASASASSTKKSGAVGRCEMKIGAVFGILGVALYGLL